MRDEIIKRNIIITIVSLLIFFIVSLFVTSYSSRKSIENQLINISNIINNQLKETTKESEIIEIINDYTKDQEWIEIVVATTNGYIVKDSSDDSIGDDYDVYLDKDELKLLEETDLDYKRVYVRNNMMYFITQISNDIIIRTAVEIETNTSYILNSLFYLLILIMGVLIVSILYTRKTSLLVTNAFDNISSHLKTINEGEYQQIETHHKFKEVEESLVEINEINKNIYSSILKIKNEHDKTNFIINNMKQGLVIIDENGKVVIINDYAKNVLKIDFENNLNIDYNKVFNEEINKKVKRALENKNDLSFDFDDVNKGKIYSFSLSNLNNKWYDLEKSVALLVIIIMDVTEERKNDAIRAEFIANASHELKTPITSIRGFSELLLSDDKQFDEKTKKHLKIIFDESVKMKETIDELLYLSNLEYRRNNIELTEKVYFKLIIEELIESYKELAKENDIKINLEIDDSYIIDSALLLKHLIGNLLENAIRYNKTNGEVYIQTKKESDKILLTIRDTGIGIEEKNLDKIFDRFYRIENSRNRNTGGTGLGLNLVKEICAILNAKIEVKSEINVGTTFNVYFNAIDL